MSEEKKNTGAANPALDDKLMKTRSVMLTGEITKESADQVVRQLLVLDSESDEPITVYINYLQHITKVKLNRKRPPGNDKLLLLTLP